MSSANSNIEKQKSIDRLKVAIGIPAFNEEKSIAAIILKLKKITSTIIVCDDGSTDLTARIANELGAQVVSHSKNMGYGAALRSIFLNAIKQNIDILVTFDADGQHKVEDIHPMLESIKKNESDIVIGSRFLKNDDNIPRFRKIGIKTITSITNTTTGIKISDAQSGFRAYHNKVLNEIIPTETGMGASTEILIKASKHKFRISEIPITISYEENTSTHHPVSHGASVIFSTIKFTAIEHPLKFYGIPGIGFLLVGLFFVIWTLQIFADTKEIITNISLIAIGTIVFGAVLLMTAVILYTTVSVIRERR